MSNSTLRDLCGNPALEALELQDVHAHDLRPSEPLGSAVTWDDVDAMWAQEMARRDGDDRGPRPPTSGAIRPRPLTADDFRADFAAYSDDDLVIACDCLDRGTVENVSESDRLAMLDAATGEVLRRIRPIRVAA